MSGFMNEVEFKLQGIFSSHDSSLLQLVLADGQGKTYSLTKESRQTTAFETGSGSPWFQHITELCTYQ